MAMEALAAVGYGDFAIDGLTSMWSCQDSVEELKQRLAQATTELEELRRSRREEMSRSEHDVGRLLQLVKTTMKERDEAREQLQLILAHLAGGGYPESPPTATTTTAGRVASSVTDSDSLSGNHQQHSYFSSSTVDSFPDAAAGANSAELPAVPQKSAVPVAPAGKYDCGDAIIDHLAQMRPLPAKGGLVQAVIGAGPLLQTLIVAGPLPRWRNPPPVRPMQVLAMSSGEVGSSGAGVTAQGLCMKRQMVAPAPEYLNAKRPHTALIGR